MSDESRQRQIRVGETDAGVELTLPVIEVLTGRGFATGKSGSGKSNTASVISEELLDAGYPLLIVDTDGEYYGLKEEYEMLHAGADEECDIQIGPEHAAQMATLALEENVPVILDVSGYLDEAVADELLKKIARQLFIKEKKLKKPFLLIVEEVHEYIPEGGGLGETGKLLIKISKRGRKHGLGILGISQRPADVKKDFITQANWLVWHRLTWDNDTKVVGRIIDTEYAELVAELNDGQAFVQTDWTEADVRKVQFRRKRTFDAGATPGLDDFERPELKSVSDALVGDLETISERKDEEQNRIAELETELEKKDQRIAELEAELESARDVSSAARQMADALSQSSGQTSLPIGGEDRRRLHEELADLEAERENLQAERDELETAYETLEAERDDLQEARTQLTAKLAGRVERIDDLETEVDDLEAEVDRLRTETEELTVENDRLRTARDAAETSEDDDRKKDADESEIVQPVGSDHEFGYTSVDETPSEPILVANDEAGETRSTRPGETVKPTENEGGRSTAEEAAGSTADEDGVTATEGAGSIEERRPWPGETEDSGSTAAETPGSTAERSPESGGEEAFGSTWLDDRIDRACENSRCSARTARDVVVVLARSEPLKTEAVAESVGRSVVAVQSLLSELTTESVLERPPGRTYSVSDRTRDALRSAGSATQQGR